jgi:hypothetical protein
MLQSLKQNAGRAALWGALLLLPAAFLATTAAAPQEPERQAFANAIEQRQEMIKQLKEVAALLKEQNELLKSGRVRVVVAAEPAQK